MSDDEKQQLHHHHYQQQQQQQQQQQEQQQEQRHHHQQQQLEEEHHQECFQDNQRCRQDERHHQNQQDQQYDKTPQFHQNESEEESQSYQQKQQQHRELVNEGVHNSKYDNSATTETQYIVNELCMRLGGNCRKHPNRAVISYCQYHHSVLCLDCLLKDHKHCIDSIETIETKLETTRVVSADIEGNFEALARQLRSWRCRQTNSLNRVTGLEDCLTSGIRQMRLNLIEQTNKRAREALEVVTSVMGDKKNTISADINFLDELQVRMEAISDAVHGDVSPLLSDYSNAMKIVDTISAVEKEYRDRNLRDHDIKCKFYVSPMVQHITKKFTSFGEVCLEENSINQKSAYLSQFADTHGETGQIVDDAYSNIFVEVPDETLRCNSVTSGRYTSIETDQRDLYHQPPELPPITERPALKIENISASRSVDLHKTDTSAEKIVGIDWKRNNDPMHASKESSSKSGDCEDNGIPIPPIPVKRSHAYNQNDFADFPINRSEVNNRNTVGKSSFTTFPFYTPPFPAHAASTPNMSLLTGIMSSKTGTKHSEDYQKSQQNEDNVTFELTNYNAANVTEGEFRDSGITETDSEPNIEQKVPLCQEPPVPHIGTGMVVPYCVKTLFSDHSGITNASSEHTENLEGDKAHLPKNSDDSDVGVRKDTPFRRKSSLSVRFRRTISSSDSNLATCKGNDLVVDSLVAATSNIDMRPIYTGQKFWNHRHVYMYGGSSNSSSDGNDSLQHVNMTELEGKVDAVCQKTNVRLPKHGVIDIFINFAKNRPPLITSLTFVDNRNIVLCDNSNDLVLMANKTGTLLDVYGISQPFGCAWMRDDRVAVTSTVRKSVCILYVSQDRLQFQREVIIASDSETLFGIAYFNGIFAVAASTSVKILDDDLQELETIVPYIFTPANKWPKTNKAVQKPFFVDVQHVACEWTVNRQFIYTSDKKKQRVACIDMSGVVKWSQQLINPRDLTFQDGDVFVACRKEVTVIEGRSGLFLREVKIGHIKNPICLAVDGRSGRLIVPVCTSKGFLKITVCPLYEYLSTV